MECVAKIELPNLGNGQKRIIRKLTEAGFHTMIIMNEIEADFDTRSLIQATENCSGNPVLLKFKGKAFERVTVVDLQNCGVHLPPSVIHTLECEFPPSLNQMDDKDDSESECVLPVSLNQMEDKDDSESEAEPFVDVIDIKQNGLVEITGKVVKNEPDVCIKWTVIDGVKKVKSGFEKGVSLYADTVTSHMREESPELSEIGLRVSEGSHGNSVVMSESSFWVISSPLKMLRFIGENAQISYSGGISAVVGVVPSILQPAGEKASASVNYIRTVALASGCLFAAFSWMLTMSKSKKDLGIIAAACAFFSMIIGLFSTIFSHIVPKYRLCLIGIFTFFLLLVAFYASGDRDIETCESGGEPDPSSSTSPSTKSFSSFTQSLPCSTTGSTSCKRLEV